ncbi:Ig-like domain-containing protein [Streptomyces sp. NPDC057877]|uniref:Ig-like domain-containing protein n=1 Tax=Streptomyces sp. NPDC057877 TaxID=3346269 RepID=UPI00367EAF0D
MPSITLDASELTYPLVAVTGGGTDYLADGAGPRPEVTLAPRAGYRLRLGDSTVAAVSFEVREDGGIDFDPAFDAFLEGRGGRRLTVRGVPVTVDARSLDHPLVLDLPEAAPLAQHRVHELRLLPADGYRLKAAAGTADSCLAFSVSGDGRVRLDPAVTDGGYADAAGRTLTVRGRTIVVDGRSLSHGLLPVGAPVTGTGFLPRTSVHRLTLLPGSGYRFQAGPGVSADFTYTVGADGTVDYPRSCDAFLAGRGTDTLVVGGFPVLLSTVRADSDLGGVTAVDDLPQAPRELAAVLTPATGYFARTAHGLCSAFRVARDGSLTFEDTGVASFTVGHPVSVPPEDSDERPTTLTVRVAAAVPGGRPPRGEVTFRAGGRVLGTVRLDDVGVATLRTAKLPTDGAGITVFYEGDDEHRPVTATVPSDDAATAQQLSPPGPPKNR